MTTERSGMSLESVRDWLRDPYNFNTPTFNELADAIDDHLSRDAVVSDEDVVAACDVYDKKREAGSIAEFMGMRAALSSFAARHAAVPDGYVLVPVEPTRKMFEAASKADDKAFIGGSIHGADVDTIWSVMVDAAQEEG